MRNTNLAENHPPYLSANREKLRIFVYQLLLRITFLARCGGGERTKWRCSPQ